MSEDSSSTPGSTPSPATVPAKAAGGVPALPPDAENPALIFARKTYIWLLVFAVGFIGAVVVLILPNN